MKEELFEALVFQWPYLFEKSDMNHIAIDDGWYTIIENLLDCICFSVETAKLRLKYEQEQYAIDSSEIRAGHVAEAEKELKTAMDELPIFKQIKEKFGGLRILADNVIPRNHTYMVSAENMAKRTCEHCGAPGKTRDTLSKMSCYCDDCFKLANGVARNINGMPYIDSGRVAPNFIDY